MLPSGAELWAVSFDASDPYSRDRAPDFGLYLDENWAPPWEHAKIPWPDFGMPSSAVAWVRTNHCEHAIETPEQEAFVRAFRTL